MPRWSTVSDAPLDGVRILDMCAGAGASASRFLGELGADVIQVRDLAASRDHASPDEPSTSFVRDTGKRSIALDLTDEADQKAFWRLAGTCQIIVEDSRPAIHHTLAVSPSALRDRVPHAVVASITGFGQTGPYRDWIATDAVLNAMSSELSRSGLPGKQPLLPPSPIAVESAASQAAWAVLVAHLSSVQTGTGGHVDVSLFETLVQTMDPGWGMGGTATGGVPAADGPRDRPDARHLYPVFACADGFVRICMLAPRQWMGMFDWLGRPVELSDPELMSLPQRFAAAPIIYPAIQHLFATLHRAEIVIAAQSHGVPVAAIFDPSEVLACDHFDERGAFVRIMTPFGEAALPNGTVVIDGHRAGIRGPAPGLDEHRDEILAEADGLCELIDIEASRAPISAVAPTKRHPLSDLRVLDLGVIVMGAELGRLFADLGADVIKVENSAFPDGGRQGRGSDPITAGFAWGHRNKRSLGLNLRSPEGLRLFKELALKSDVILSNFKPGTMESLGLGWDVLSGLNPRLIVADSSAYGQTGPWSRRMGYGPLVRSETGLTSLWRYPESGDGFSDASTIYPDHTAARVAASGVLALLLRRMREGRGGTVSVAQAEVILNHLGPAFAVESLRPGSLTAAGNQLRGDAPRGVFPCLGDDEWVVVDVAGTDTFRRLSTVIGRPLWASDPRFATAADRDANRDHITEVVAAWTRTRTPREAAHLFQSAGIAAGMMLRVPELLHDQHLTERDFFRSMHHPLLSQALPAENLPALFTAVADAPQRPAPLAGEHTYEVLGSVLGLDRSTIDDLVSRGFVETTPQHSAFSHDQLISSSHTHDERLDPS
ncbi:CoA transferase [Rhodococcus sp. BP-349]|uniref:CaiB/BaiF CoA transferase family protein n=1 Tax=unclassified Rhodococcus (in: high G+C Gram-positive bacteria) TaxID=192944 RepID=UPI001C9A81C8|nr:MULTISPECIES: CoA transferase [unclassified Rhodococcus (in: high G+C Gram-positive bacteria)]MBY6537822.1 CoA transferase [Rhodococcus sp. BP-363]MBY6542159.1 CoA transferase [Rhodococcus sp. BP-369]MBY6561389.1 CoA transferase [Rhodococcus sp. BP-370]MBY6575681.1 CoA transferase [Rhodococcus sp. BP-364]MBY6584982.1 CoA transferase [Rhodococcus sp. BP-358]